MTRLLLASAVVLAFAGDAVAFDPLQSARRAASEGQRAFARSSVLIVGCGALGSVIASFVARAGVGRVTLVDPDKVESSNLHRQILFDEADAAAGRAKVDAACARVKDLVVYATGFFIFFS